MGQTAEPTPRDVVHQQPGVQAKFIVSRPAQHLVLPATFCGSSESAIRPVGSAIGSALVFLAGTKRPDFLRSLDSISIGTRIARGEGKPFFPSPFREVSTVSYRFSPIVSLCRPVFVAILLVGLTTNVQGDEPNSNADLKLRGSEGIVANKNLAGTWKLIRSVNQGKKTDKKEIRGSEVIVRENEMTVFDADKKELYRCEFQFDRTDAPNTITMKSTTPG